MKRKSLFILLCLILLPAPAIWAKGEKTHNRETKKISRNFGITGIDARWSNFGQYLQKFIDTVQSQFDALNDKNTSKIPNGTKVSVKFRFDSTGKISEILKTDSNGSPQATRICVSAITDRAPYTKWTDAMVAMLGKSQEMTLTFYYGTP